MTPVIVILSIVVLSLVYASACIIYNKLNVPENINPLMEYLVIGMIMVGVILPPISSYIIKKGELLMKTI
jgi:hypothetical protein